MKLTPAELTVLGLIVEHPRHGYDLEQVIEERGIRRWTDIGFSSIYYVLTKLEDRGLISDHGHPSGAKSRRVLHATTQGRQVAAAQALEFIADLRAVPHPILVGLANLPLIAEPDYSEALRSRLTQVETRIVAAAKAKAAQAPLPRPAHEVFSYSLNLLEAERSWLANRVQVQHE
ncbi:PadR family transcriptional regulator [Mycobacterium sp. BMJ-28]